MINTQEIGNYEIYLADGCKKTPLAILTKIKKAYVQEIADMLKTNRTIFAVVNPFDPTNNHFGLNNPYFGKDIRTEELPNEEARKLKSKLERRLS